MNSKVITLLGAMVAALTTPIAQSQESTKPLRDPCSAIRDAVTETDNAERVRIMRTVVEADGASTQTEKRLIGDLDYERHADELTWDAGPRYTVMEINPWTRPWNCRLTSREELNGMAATVWSYGRQIEGHRALVKMWVDDNSGRMLRTELTFKSEHAPYRHVFNDLDYSTAINAPEEVR